MSPCSNPLVHDWYSVSACPDALLIFIIRPVLLSLLFWVTTFHELVIIVLIATAPGGYVTYQTSLLRICYQLFYFHLRYIFIIALDCHHLSLVF